jgi:hypothetical protein
MSKFTKAEKRQAKFRGAITGPSGSGKTFSALLIAAGLGKKIAVVDTENHSASLYAGEKNIPDFDILEIEPPYTITKYIDAIQEAVKEGYEVLVIDSITHAWAGEGGLLAQKEALDGSGRGNGYTNWAIITKDHEKFKSWLLKVDVHLIATMRSKQDYVLETNDKGKQAPKKVGLAPIQREGMEYEFTMVLDMAMNHFATVSKTRMNAFDGKFFMPDKKTGEEILNWLEQGTVAPKVPEPPKVAPAPAPAATAPKPAEPLPETKPMPEIGAPENMVVTVVEVMAKEYKPGKWRYGIKTDEGETFGTFSETDYKTAEECRIKGVKVDILFRTKMVNGKFMCNIEGLRPYSPELIKEEPTYA